MSNVSCAGHFMCESFLGGDVSFGGRFMFRTFHVCGMCLGGTFRLCSASKKPVSITPDNRGA